MRIRLAETIEQGDTLNLLPAAGEDPEHHSEWHHFNFNDDANGLYGIFNMALSGDLRDPQRSRVGVSLVVCERGRWRGTMSLYQVEEARFTPGTVDLQIGPNSVRFRDAGYLVSGTLKDRSIRLSATWKPLCLGVRIDNIGSLISTFIVPRLSVEGSLAIEGREYKLDGATGYHDHNWGQWRWGRDLGWDWGYVIQRPDDEASTPPLSIIFGQVTDATRAVARSDLVLMTWQGEHCTQVFLDDAVEITTSGELPATDIPRVPGLLTFVELRRHGLPRSLLVRVADGDDSLELQMDVHNGLQFLIPRTVGAGITTVSELLGRYRVRGMLGGQSLDFSYVGFAELAG
jgi:hypothetical protein